ncbi:MAG: hypothetical protein LBJ41_07355 [Treponema sp.]|nr:hypothetical protein [Treponema sp.]
MKKLIFTLLLCCATVVFATSCALSRFSSSGAEVVLDESEDGVLGHFDIEVKVPKPHRDFSLSGNDPAIRDAIKQEIAKHGGTRAIHINIDGRETFGSIIVRITGTVVK